MTRSFFDLDQAFIPINVDFLFHLLWFSSDGVLNVKRLDLPYIASTGKALILAGSYQCFQDA
jgi:hypothetical protein